MVKHADELRDAHPAVAAYWQHEESRTFARDEVVRHVRPAYQGLISQLDDHLGRLFEFMDRQGLAWDTLVVFRADHGDFLGDAQMRDRLLDFLARRKHRTSVSDEFVASRTDTHKMAGVFYSQW